MKLNPFEFLLMNNPLQALMIHPYRHMYSEDEFVAYAKVCGFAITHLHRPNPLGLIKFFRMVARA